MLELPKHRLKYFPNLMRNRLRVLSNHTVVEEFEDNVESISALYVYGSKEGLNGKFDFGQALQRYANLKALSVPYYLIPKFNELGIPESIEVLAIEVPEEIRKNDKIPVFHDFVAPNIKSLIISYKIPSPSVCVDNLFDITPRDLPNLEYLNCRIDKRGSVIDKIRSFKTLSFLEVEYSGDNNLFDAVSSPLDSLVIVGSGRNFSLRNISRIDTLKRVLLNGMKCEIDCSVFSLLPNLKELAIWNSKKLLNVEALFDSNKLRKLSLINCGKPLREIYGRIDVGKFELLDIEFS